MKVLLLVHALSGGGAESVAVLWAEGLAVRGHDVHVLTYADTSPAGARVAGCRTSHFPGAGGAGRHLALPRWVAQVCREEGTEAAVGVLTYSNLVLLRAGLRSCGVATVITEHNMLPSLLQTQGRTGRVQDLLAQRLYRRADAAVGASHAVAAALAARYAVTEERLWVVPNPLRPRGGQVGGQAAPLRVMFVGRLDDAKRPQRLLDTCAELALRGRPVEAVVVGAGPLEEQLTRAAEAAGVPLRLVGWQPDWSTCARRGDVLLLPSPTEGFGNVLVEAAQAGVPAVAASQALGVADAIVDGVTGALARSPRPTDLADAVERAAALPPVPRDVVAAWSARWSPGASVDTLERVLTSIKGG